MDVLQQSLNQAMEKVPTLLLEKLISKKLKEQGVQGKALSRKIAEHIVSGKGDTFRFRSTKHKGNITLTFDKADTDEITRAFDVFSKTQLPKLLPEVAGRVSKSVLKTLNARWAEEHSLQNADLSEFRKHLEERWGKPLNQLRMLLTIAREWCGNIHERENSRKRHKKKQLNRLLIRLLVRACQVTDEIVCLLENGFSDGAIASWRTLHEIAVIAAVIARNGESIAERYMAHHAVESKRALDKYMACYKQLGYRPFSKREHGKILRAFDKVMAQYGKAFKSDYGWAALHLKNERPTFVDLEMEAGRAEMRSYYQLGSDNIHAGVKSMFFRLGLLENDRGLLAGRSNIGLVDPGQNAAHTLTQLCILVCLSKPTFDDLVTAEVMRLLRNEILGSFYRANKSIAMDIKNNGRIGQQQPASG